MQTWRHEGRSRPATLLKKRLWHRCFPVNFVTFLRTPFLQNTSGRLLLEIIEKGSNNKGRYNLFIFQKMEKNWILNISSICIWLFTFSQLWLHITFYVWPYFPPDIYDARKLWRFFDLISIHIYYLSVGNWPCKYGLKPLTY